MTILAWDGVNLAADKQSTSGSYRRCVTKIFATPEGIVGFTGSGVAAVAMRDWFMQGRNPNQWPSIQQTDKDAYSLFIDWSGQVWMYEDYPHGMLIEASYEACGSGRDFALAALHLGHSAMKAVEVASALANCCGMGMDVLNLADEKKKWLERQHRAVSQSV